MTELVESTEFTVHVFVQGTTHRLTSTELDIGDLTPEPQVKTAVETALGLAANSLRGYSVTANEGNWILDPPATLGAGSNGRSGAPTMSEAEVLETVKQEMFNQMTTEAYEDLCLEFNGLLGNLSSDVRVTLLIDSSASDEPQFNVEVEVVGPKHMRDSKVGVTAFSQTVARVGEFKAPHILDVIEEILSILGGVDDLEMGIG